MLSNYATKHTGWPQKVNHYQMIKIVLNRIKACQ